MLNHLPDNPSQANKRALIRRYGYGVPDLARAIRSLSNDVTMVIEGRLQPYAANGGGVKTKDMILHDLPWPVDVLEGLGQTNVQMKTTLSYFIEPNPGGKGPGTAHFVNRDMTQRLVAPRLDFGGTPSMCVVVSIGETDGHHCFKLHGAQQRQARR